MTSSSYTLIQSEDVDKITYCTGGSRHERRVDVHKEPVDRFLSRFHTPARAETTMSETDSLSPDDVARVKDGGWWFGGTFSPQIRKRNNVRDRTVLALDLDKAYPWDSVEDVAVQTTSSTGAVCLVHTTFSHRVNAPRMRLVVPLARQIGRDMYEPLGRYVADNVGIEMFDGTTYQLSRIMYWPVVCSDAEYMYFQTEGHLLDAEKYLASLPKKGWMDWKKWPRATTEPPKHKPSDKMEDPLEKAGIIGAFNRVYSISDAIAKFGLPYRRVHGNRWAYTKGHGAAGACLFEADALFHSWHDTDPAVGTHNAWDLVRIHKHGKLDKGRVAGVPITERPSQEAMRIEALSIPEVIAEHTKSEFSASDSFDQMAKEIKRKRKAGREWRIQKTQQIAASGLSESDKDTLISKLRDSLDPKDRPPKTAMLADLRAMQKAISSANREDMDMDFMNAVLDDHYDSGRLVRRFAKKFWVYGDGYWHMEEDEVVKDRAQQTCVNLRENSRDSKNLAELVAEKSTSRIIRDTWQSFCAHVAGIDSSRDPMRLMDMDVESVMNCINGELVFSNGDTPDFRPHDPSRFLTHRLGVEYDADADTSHWDEFRELLFAESDNPEENYQHLEEVAGYILQPWRELATFCLMRGEPNSGKTTFGQVLNTMLGPASANRDMSRYRGDDAHDTAGLVGKLLLLDEDYEAGGLLPDGFIKRISEGKQVTANPKYGSQFEFVCRSVPFVISNQWPSLRDHSGGMERRALVWDLRELPESKRSNKKKNDLLSYGLSGAFLRFVEGFQRLRNRDGWDIPKECLDARERWFGSADSVKAWLDENVVRDKSTYLKRSETYPHYTHWHSENMPNSRAVSRREFYARVDRRIGNTTKRSDHVWRGYKLKPIEEPSFKDEG